MTPKDSDGSSDSDFGDSGDLHWSEFDWEKYLRSQDDIIHRYLGFYEQLADSEDRIDDAAQLMGWNDAAESDLTEDQPEEAQQEAADIEPYTLQRNPVYIATTAIYLSVTRLWERHAIDHSAIPASITVGLLSSLHRGERQAILGIQALDLGDYTMTISLLKRAMRELNESLNYLNAETEKSDALGTFRDQALPRLFDLREVWLRVIAECRDAVARRGGNRSDNPSSNQ